MENRSRRGGHAHSSSIIASEAVPERQLRLQDYVSMVRRNTTLLIVITLLGVLVAGVACIVRPQQYEATAELYVSVATDELSAGELMQGAEFSRRAVEAYAHIAKSDQVLQPVISELGLSQSSSELSEQISVTAIDPTSILAVTARGDDPELAARVANSVGASLSTYITTELETGGSLSATTGSVRITKFQDALVPHAPVPPSVPVALIIGAVLGLAVGVCVALIRGSLDSRLYTRDDIAEVTEHPIIGEIVALKKPLSVPLTSNASGGGQHAESLRELRTNISPGRSEPEVARSCRSIVFAAGADSEGASSTAVQLAISLAAAEYRVVLVDGDLRAPRVAEILGIRKGAGLAELLAGTAHPADALHAWGDSGLSVIPSGKPASNPSELLESKRFGLLMEELARNFEFVIVDAPPVSTATDASIIGRHMDGMVYTVATGVSRAPVLEESLRKLATAGVSVLGIVRTRVPQSRAERRAERRRLRAAVPVRPATPKKGA